MINRRTKRTILSGLILIQISLMFSFYGFAGLLISSSAYMAGAAIMYLIIDWMDEPEESTDQTLADPNLSQTVTGPDSYLPLANIQHLKDNGKNIVSGVRSKTIFFDTGYESAYPCHITNPKQMYSGREILSLAYVLDNKLLFLDPEPYNWILKKMLPFGGFEIIQPDDITEIHDQLLFQISHKDETFTMTGKDDPNLKTIPFPGSRRPLL